MRQPSLPRTSLMALLGALVLATAPLAQARTQPAEASAPPAVHRHASHPAAQRAGQRTVTKAHSRQHAVAQARTHKTGVKTTHASAHAHVARAGSAKAHGQHSTRVATKGATRTVAHAKSRAKPHAQTTAHAGGAAKTRSQHVAHRGKARHGGHGSTPRA